MTDRRADTVTDRTPLRRIGLDDDLWERFEIAAKRSDPDTSRSAILRKFTRWFVGDIDEMPQRPEPSPPRRD